MTPEQCKKLLDDGIFKALSEGKTLQYRNSNNEWKDIYNPSFGGGHQFRVKPEPKYRPFTFTEITDLLGKVIVNRGISYMINSITMFRDKSWDIKITRVHNSDTLSISSKDLLNYYTLNEKPCGVLDETGV